jgi:hypothetical protein
VRFRESFGTLLPEYSFCRGDVARTFARERHPHSDRYLDALIFGLQKQREKNIKTSCVGVAEVVGRSGMPRALINKCNGLAGSKAWGDRMPSVAMAADDAWQQRNCCLCAVLL